MGKLSEHHRARPGTGRIDRLPPEIMDQLIEGRQGTLAVADMIHWLHNDPDFGDEYKGITRTALSAWFLDHGYLSGRGPGHPTVDRV